MEGSWLASSVVVPTGSYSGSLTAASAWLSWMALIIVVGFRVPRLAGRLPVHAGRRLYSEVSSSQANNQVLEDRPREAAFLCGPVGISLGDGAFVRVVGTQGPFGPG